MPMATTATKAFFLLAAAASLAALGTASTARAQYGNSGLGTVERCSLSGVNPADHPEIFGNPATARSYGFVQSNGSWSVAPGCRRGGARAASASAGPAPAKGRSAQAKGEPPLMSNGMCWLNTGGTHYRWGDCP